MRLIIRAKFESIQTLSANAERVLSFKVFSSLPNLHLRFSLGEFMQVYKGQKFYELTAVHIDHKAVGRVRWICMCSCGISKSIMSVNLLRGNTKSCGHLRKPNLLGKTFGLWKVVGLAASRGGIAYWRCRCKCGTVKEVAAGSLASARSNSCGCEYLHRKRKILLGQRFGKLVVKKFSHISLGNRAKTLWLCICDCGNEKIVRGTHLTEGSVQSCGCLGGGFRTTNSAIFYIIKTDKFIGYGITGAIDRRINEHRKTFALLRIKERTVHYIKFRKGALAKQLEKRIQSELPSFDYTIKDFQREALSLKTEPALMAILGNRRVYTYAS